MEPVERYDVVVVGAGFGGLGAALSLAEAGARVLLLERLRYPGGCACTFERRGATFDAGATLSSGFAEGQLFRRWIDRYELPVDTLPLDPVVRFRARDFAIDVPPAREELVARFCAMSGAPQKNIERFFRRQNRIASVLWSVLDRPDLLPPFTAASLREHASRASTYLPLLPLLGVPLADVMELDGVGAFRPLRTYVDALCQITVQTSAARAEAPFALGAMDYYFRGVAHVRGGMGALAWALSRAIERAGGEVRFSTAATRFVRQGISGWRVETRRGPLEASALVANVLPQTFRRLAPNTRWQGSRLATEVEASWGAVMSYRSLRDHDALPGGPAHLQLVRDPDAALTHGNHVFCSLAEPSSRRGDEAHRRRSLTVSTHVPVEELQSLDGPARASRLREIHERMDATIATLAPELHHDEAFEMTASPRTFERFTARDHGLVGGVPRRTGLHHYAALGPFEVARAAFLVGDSVFPGQSVLATATGGTRAAAAIEKAFR